MDSELFHVTYRPELGMADMDLDCRLAMIARHIVADPDFQDIEIGGELVIHGPVTYAIRDAIADRLIFHLESIESAALH